MTTPTLDRQATSVPRDLSTLRLPWRYRASRWVRDRMLAVYAALALLYLFLPIAVVIAFSFNSPAGRQNTKWNEFSLNAWQHICGQPEICTSVGVSVKVALLSTLVSTIIGTMIAFALVRHRFGGRETTNLLIFLPMATPEVVLGSSLLALFVNLTFVPLGFWTIFIAHVMFCISFVVVTVKARLQGLDPRLEQAAMDLYANEYKTFRYVTLPLVAPGIAAAALLAFSLSFDDFIITNFNNGSTVTFPVYIWGAAQRGIPVQVNVIGSIFFLGSLAIVVSGQLLRRKKA